eukprot:1183312-Prorocentrum_minimum.AAC.2
MTVMRCTILQHTSRALLSTASATNVRRASAALRGLERKTGRPAVTVPAWHLQKCGVPVNHLSWRTRGVASAAEVASEAIVGPAWNNSDAYASLTCEELNADLAEVERLVGELQTLCAVRVRVRTLVLFQLSNGYLKMH